MNFGPTGTLSGHLHDFWGGQIKSDSTYESLISSPTTCAVTADHAGYWTPALINPDGSKVPPSWMRSYYRNRPEKYGSTVTPPNGFQLIVQHDMNSFGQNATGWWWNCHDRDTDATVFTQPPLDCGSNDTINLTIMFPNCWDGVSLGDKGDHKSHVVFPVGNTQTSCPQSHPVKIPSIRYGIQYPSDRVKSGAKFSDGTTIPHADFYDGWIKEDPDPANKKFGFETWLNACTRAGINCQTVFDGDTPP